MLEIIAYIFSIIIVYNILKIQYKIINYNGAKIKEYTISWMSIVFFTLIFVSINYIYTNMLGLEVDGDRIHYRAGYNNDLSPSLGLLFVYSIGQNFHLDFNEFALLITGLSVPLVFIAYRLAKGNTPLMMLFFLLTPYIINGFDNFKQTFTNGFACLFFALLIRNQTFTNNIICILLVVLAFTFHPTGFILVIFYIIYKLDIKIKNYWGIFIILFVVTLSLKPMLLMVASILGSYVPFLTDKIHQYFDDDTLQSEGRIIVALKGLIYFFITFQILRHKSELQRMIPNFSFNIIICMFCCFLFLLSYHNVWMPRMAELFIFPIMLFWVKCISYIPYKQQNIFITCLLTAFFTFRLIWLSVVNPIQ